MGQEVDVAHFQHQDFRRFTQRLKREGEVLREFFAAKHFSRNKAIGGLELEGWLIRPDGTPTPSNEEFLARCSNPDIVPELSKFNFELNVEPRALAGRGLVGFEEDLARTWKRCETVAAEMGLDVLAIGIPPTLCDRDLCPGNMSSLLRYRALNEQLLRVRQGVPVRLDILGREYVVSEHRDVMLEAGATSFQVHLQVNPAAAARYWNVSGIASAPLVAVSANSPFLFGRSLWDETRIPLFEQAFGTHHPERRVTFGSRWVESVEEIFAENLVHYPPMLPVEIDEPETRLPHLRLHNGTIWRWNRALIGFEGDGTPHLRIEHRPLPAGPTFVDMVAGMAFYYGLVEWMAMEPHSPDRRLEFAIAKQNFYEAARLGLQAHIQWYDGKRWEVARLISDVLLDQARKGLRALHADNDVAERYLSIIGERAASGRTGAAFQRSFVDKYGRDFGALVRAYRELQRAGEPVHTWQV